jgi:hypothetical protein
MELSPIDRRRDKRFNFYHGIECRIVATDGTWQRSCVMEDASNSGARLILNGGSIDGLHLKQFFSGSPDVWPGISALRARVGQWQPDRRQFSGGNQKTRLRASSQRAARSRRRRERISRAEVRRCALFPRQDGSGSAIRSTPSSAARLRCRETRLPQARARKGRGDRRARP